MLKSKVTLITLLIIAAIFLSGFSVNAWVETILDDSSTFTGYQSDIAIDSKGHLHISYLDISNGKLKYATNGSGTWSTIEIDTASVVYLTHQPTNANNTSIAIDSADHVHIGYYSYETGPKYATNASGKWEITNIPYYNGYGFFISLALDSKDYVHMCFSFFDIGLPAKLYYATNSSGSWTLERVRQAATYNNSLVVDSNDKIHIVYSHSTDDIDYIEHTTNISGEWATTTIDQGSRPSLAIDSSDNLYISYMYEPELANPYDLKYATNKTGNWTTATIDSYYSMGETSSIALDPTGNVHVSYYGKYFSIYKAGRLKYATNMSPVYNTTGTWSYVSELYMVRK